VDASQDSGLLEALQRVREISDAQLPSLTLPPRQLDRATLQRFSPELPEVRSEADEEELRTQIERLSPWLQGPFYLGGEVLIEGLWRNDQRWEEMRPYVPEVAGKRVLDVGSNAGYDPFMFHALGANHVLACEPFEFIAQAQFLESIYCTGVRFERIGWQQLDPHVHGTFDLVHCNGLLYHEPNPLGLLQRLRLMLADGGELLLGSMMLADAELSEYVRFVRNDYASDPSWWWVPGRLALRWMMDASGFETAVLPVRFSGPAGGFEVINGYVRGRPAEPDSQLAVTESIRPVSGKEQPGATADAPVNRFPIGHYYSPMYDSRELAAQRGRIWPSAPRETVGIDWRQTAQIELCGVLARQAQFDFVDEPTADPTVYHALNDQYPPLDAWVLSGVLQHFRPTRMVEVGCGFSTLVSARTNRECLDMSMRLTCIEPHPRDFLLAGVPGVSDLRVEKVQDTPLEVFSELQNGDVLFIDTSHTVKTGGDVNWLFLEIIPRLEPGVVVHIHDVFVPGEYPEVWVMDGWGWNECYLVRAFLTFNDQFEILWGAQYMLSNHPATVYGAFKGLQRYPPGGGSLWIRRRGA
jgi:SAM-dependent methyltransferase/predicted O-methyltransferase YrrM